MGAATLNEAPMPEPKTREELIQAIEARTQKRVDAMLEVKLFTHQEVRDTQSRTANVSEDGLFVITSAPLPVGITVRAEVTLPNGNTVQGFAEVVWIRPHFESRQRPNGMGLQYKAIRDLDRQRLRQFVLQILGDCA